MLHLSLFLSLCSASLCLLHSSFRLWPHLPDSCLRQLHDSFPSLVNNQSRKAFVDKLIQACISQHIHLSPLQSQPLQQPKLEITFSVLSFPVSSLGCKSHEIRTILVDCAPPQLTMTGSDKSMTSFLTALAKCQF